MRHARRWVVQRRARWVPPKSRVYLPEPEIDKDILRVGFPGFISRIHTAYMGAYLHFSFDFELQKHAVFFLPSHLNNHLGGFGCPRMKEKRWVVCLYVYT